MAPKKTVGYAILAVGHIARERESHLIGADCIAHHYDLPIEYVQSAMHSLTRHGVLVGKRGPYGGFRLARPAEKITLLEIIEAVSGNIPTSLGFSPTDRYARAADAAYGKILESARKQFSRVTVASLLKRAL